MFAASSADAGVGRYSRRGVVFHQQSLERIGVALADEVEQRISFGSVHAEYSG